MPCLDLGALAWAVPGCAAQTFKTRNNNPHHRNPDVGKRQIDYDHLLDTGVVQALEFPAYVLANRWCFVRRRLPEGSTPPAGLPSR